MPIYEYWCAGCNTEFEQLRPMSQASEPAPCPTCGTASEKLPSVFASKADYTIKVPRSGGRRDRGGPDHPTADFAFCHTCCPPPSSPPDALSPRWR